MESIPLDSKEADKFIMRIEDSQKPAGYKASSFPRRIHIWGLHWL